MAEPAPPPTEPTAPPAALPAPAAPGTYEASTGKALVVDAAGEVYRIDPDKIAQAEQAGFRPATEAEYLAARRGTLGELEAGITGAARGATFGLLDPITVGAARALQGEERAEQVREALRRERETYSTASTVGEIAGSLLPLALGAGGASAARAAGGVGAAGAAEAAATTAARGALARAGARALEAAPRLAAEGAAIGIGQQLSEDTLGNHEIVAGKYLAAGLEGGALNLLVGAGLIAGGGAIADRFAARQAKRLARAETAAASDAVRAAKPVAEGATKPNAADRIAKTYIENLPVSTPELRAELAEAWANRERTFANRRKTIDDATRRFASDLNEALDAGRKADMATFGEAKVNQMSRLVDRTRFDVQARAAREWIDDANRTVEAMRADAATGFGPTAFKRWNAHVKRVHEAIDAGDSIRLHTALDELKRFAGREAAFGRGPFGLTVAQREFEALYQGENGLKQLLESEIWGEAAAAAQREINAATHEMLANGELFSRKFTTRFGSDAGRPTYTADTAAINAFMNRLTSAANDLDARGVEEWMRTRKGFLDAIERSYTFDAQTSNAIAAERRALARMEATYREATKSAELANTVRDALAEERARGIGGAIGAVVDLAGKPFTTLERLAHLEHTAGGIRDRLFGVREAVARYDAKQDAAVKAFFGHGPPPPRKADAKVTPAQRSAIRAAVTNPSALTEYVSDYVSQLGIRDVAPNVTRALTSQVMRAATYVRDRLPREPPPIGMSFGPTEPRELGPRAQAELDRAARALDPEAILDDLAHGTLMREQVEALKFINPPLFASIQNAIREYGMENNPHVSTQQEMALSILFDTPVSVYTQPATIRGLQQVFAVGDQPSQQPTGSASLTPIGNGESERVDELRSPTERLEDDDAL